MADEDVNLEESKLSTATGQNGSIGEPVVHGFFLLRFEF